jgi:hypothetical protein
MMTIISTRYYRGYGEFFTVLFINLAKSNNKILGLMTQKLAMATKN